MRPADSKKTVLLRHRFDSVEQMRKHLHVTEGSTLMFFRAPTLSLAVGTPLLLELCLHNSEQTRVLRGSVLARAEEQGLWLQFPSTRFARDVQSSGIVTRRGRRVGSDRLVRLRRASGDEYLAMLLDVSQAGARVGGGLPPGIAKGHQLDVVLAAAEPGQSANLGKATIAWVEEGEAGISFDRSSPAARVAITKFFHSVEAPWKQAVEVRHLQDCCGKAGLREPPLPRLRADRQGGVAVVDDAMLAQLAASGTKK
jgi:hypothetical protein